MVITDPEADPYACSHDGGSSYKCGYKSAFHIFEDKKHYHAKFLLFSYFSPTPRLSSGSATLRHLRRSSTVLPCTRNKRNFELDWYPEALDSCLFQKLPRIQFSEEGFFVRMATLWLLFLLKSCFLAYHAPTGAFLATAPTAEAETGKKLNTLLFKWVDHVLQNLWLNSCLIFQL